MEVIKFVIDSVDNTAQKTEGMGYGISGISPATTALIAVVDKVSKLRDDTERFASKIRNDSPSVEMAMIRRELVQFRSNRESERIAGRSISNYMNAATETDRQWQRLETQLTKMQAEILRPLEDIKQLLIAKLVTWLEEHEGDIKDIFDVDLWQTAARAFILEWTTGNFGGAIDKLWEEYEKRKAAERMEQEQKMDALNQLLKTPIIPPNLPRPGTGTPFNTSNI